MNRRAVLQRLQRCAQRRLLSSAAESTRLCTAPAPHRARSALLAAAAVAGGSLLLLELNAGGSHVSEVPNDYYTVPGPPDSNSQSQFAATNYHSPAGGYEEQAATAVVTAAAPTSAPQTGTAVGVGGVTEPALGAQQQSFLACQSQVTALQQQQLAAQNSGDQQAASLAQAQMEQQQAQCQALLQAGR